MGTVMTGTGILGTADVVIGVAENTVNSDTACAESGGEAVWCIGAFICAENDANAVVSGVVVTSLLIDGVGDKGIAAPSNSGIGSVVGATCGGESDYGHSNNAGETGYALAELYCRFRVRG